MNSISCVIIVGKPGAGKSSIGSALAQSLDASYTSLGSFMREELGIPDPHIGIDKNFVYEKLLERLLDNDSVKTLILDCHPYPDDDFDALSSFIAKPNLELLSIIHVDADDDTALGRLKRRPRPGQTYADRLKYYNDHSHLIDQLMKHPSSIRIENNIDFESPDTLRTLAEEVFKKLQNRTA